MTIGSNPGITCCSMCGAETLVHLRPTPPGRLALCQASHPGRQNVRNCWNDAAAGFRPGVSLSHYEAARPRLPFRDAVQNADSGGSDGSRRPMTYTTIPSGCDLRLPDERRAAERDHEWHLRTEVPARTLRSVQNAEPRLAGSHGPDAQGCPEQQRPRHHD